MEKIIHIAHDVSEQKKLEKKLGQARKMEAIGTLAGGIAHDFNNILAVIQGYTELAKLQSTVGSQTEEYLQQIMLAGIRAKELVKQILAFSRHVETAKVPLQVASIVKEVLKLPRSSLPTTITIEQDIDEESGMILADPTEIHQIIMNICTNAFHAMEPTGGILSVRLQRTFLYGPSLENVSNMQPGNFLQLSIGDTGPGIDPDIQGKIFEPFFTTKEVGKGTGMGLAITHGIVKSCGGFISCNSQEEKGTVFSINFPLLHEPSLLESQVVKKNYSGTEHILFVDDEKMLTDIGKIMLEQFGYSVTVSTSSIEALSIFAKQPDAFDLVITDQTMPGMPGIDLTRKMLDIRPNLPIILCTGYSSTVSAETARAAGIRGFAMKPLVMDDIGAVIREILT